MTEINLEQNVSEETVTGDVNGNLEGSQEQETQTVESQASDGAGQEDLREAIKELKEQYHRLSSDNGRIKKSLFSREEQKDTSERPSFNQGQQYQQQQRVPEDDGDPIIKLYGEESGRPLSTSIKSVLQKEIERVLSPHMNALSQVNAALNASEFSVQNKRQINAAFGNVPFEDVKTVLLEAGADETDLAKVKAGFLPFEEVAPYYKKAMERRLMSGKNGVSNIAEKLNKANKSLKPTLVESKQTQEQVSLLQQIEGKSQEQISLLIDKNPALRKAILEAEKYGT